MPKGRLYHCTVLARLFRLLMNLHIWPEVSCLEAHDLYLMLCHAHLCISRLRHIQFRECGSIDTARETKYKLC